MVRKFRSRAVAANPERTTTLRIKKSRTNLSTDGKGCHPLLAAKKMRKKKRAKGGHWNNNTLEVTAQPRNSQLSTFIQKKNGQERPGNESMVCRGYDSVLTKFAEQPLCTLSSFGSAVGWTGCETKGGGKTTMASNNQQPDVSMLAAVSRGQLAVTQGGPQNHRPSPTDTFGPMVTFADGVSSADHKHGVSGLYEHNKFLMTQSESRYGDSSKWSPPTHQIKPASKPWQESASLPVKKDRLGGTETNGKADSSSHSSEIGQENGDLLWTPSNLNKRRGKKVGQKKKPADVSKERQSFLVFEPDDMHSTSLDKVSNSTKPSSHSSPTKHAKRQLQKTAQSAVFSPATTSSIPTHSTGPRFESRRQDELASPQHASSHPSHQRYTSSPKSKMHQVTMKKKKRLNFFAMIKGKASKKSRRSKNNKEQVIISKRSAIIPPDQEENSASSWRGEMERIRHLKMADEFDRRQQQRRRIFEFERDPNTNIDPWDSGFSAASEDDLDVTSSLTDPSWDWEDDTDYISDEELSISDETVTITDTAASLSHRAVREAAWVGKTTPAELKCNKSRKPWCFDAPPSPSPNLSSSSSSDSDSDAYRFQENPSPRWKNHFVTQKEGFRFCSSC